MECDDREIPESPVVGASADYWIAGVGIFEGVAALLANDGTLAPGYEVGVTGTVALAVGRNQFICILSPNEATAPSMWLATSLADLGITATGKVGVFKKRPQHIQVSCDGWSLVLGQVSSVDREAGFRQGGKEASLLSVLTSSSGKSTY
jgi:hypothetical protein